MDKKRRIRRKMFQMNAERKAVNIFDEARNDISYRDHRREVIRAKKKIDNSNPVISSVLVYSQAKYREMKKRLEFRLTQNLRTVKFLNEKARFKGQLDCHNPMAVLRKSKVRENIIEQEIINKQNKFKLNVLKQIEPSYVSCKAALDYEWDTVLLPTIINSNKRAAAISSLLTPELDPDLEAPPTLSLLRKSKKVFFIFLSEYGVVMGKVQIMLNPDVKPLIIDKFMENCSNNCYAGCTVYKIIPGLIIEAGDIIRDDGSGKDRQCDIKLCPSACNRSLDVYAGTVGLLLEDDGSLSSKLAITLSKTSIFKTNQVIIGRVVKGFNVVLALEQFGTHFGRPKRKVTIGCCGTFELR